MKHLFPVNKPLFTTTVLLPVHSCRYNFEKNIHWFLKAESCHSVCEKFMRKCDSFARNLCEDKTCSIIDITIATASALRDVGNILSAGGGWHLLVEPRTGH